MARKPRIHPPGDLVHMVSRGVRHQDIFEEPRQWTAFLQCLSENAKAVGMTLYGYALIPNHFHIMARIREIGPSIVMQRTLTMFAVRSNRHFGRTGHVFEGRFFSESIEDDAHAKAKLRYVHRNPLKAHLVEDLMDWPWTSHGAYMGLADDPYVDTAFMLSLFSEDPVAARRAYSDFMKSDYKGPSEIPTCSLAHLEQMVCEQDAVTGSAVRSNCKQPAIVRARQRLIRLALEAGHAPPEIASFLGVDRTTVFRARRC